MKQYKVFYYLTPSGINPAYKILYANCEEDAKIKADVDQDSIYHVCLLDDWLQFNDDRRGYYLGKDLPKTRTKICWAKDFFNRKKQRT